MQMYIAKHSLLAAADRPIYMYEYGTPLTLLVRKAHKMVFIFSGFFNPKEYCGDSYRIGGATTAGELCNQLL